MPTTSSPRSRSSFAVWKPMKPAAPVTRIFIPHSSPWKPGTGSPARPFSGPSKTGMFSSEPPGTDSRRPRKGMGTKACLWFRRSQSSIHFVLLEHVLDVIEHVLGLAELLDAREPHLAELVVPDGHHDGVVATLA